LKKQKTNLAMKVEQKKTISNVELPLLSVSILALLQQHERLTIAQMAKMTAGNKNTLKLRLRELVNAGHIQRRGKARAT